MKLFSPLITIILGSMLFNCTPEERVASKDELFVYLDSLEHEYEAACSAMGTANWNSYSKEGPAQLDSARAQFARIFLDEQGRLTIAEWRSNSRSLADDRLSRRLEIWYRCFIGGRIYADPEIAARENALQQLITNFRFTFEDNPISQAQIGNRLREETSQQLRQRLWEVTGQLSAGAHDGLIDLIRLRNDRARKSGFSNYYSLVLSLHGIDEKWLLQTLRELEERTRPSFETFVNASKRKLKVKKLRPWDFDFALREAAGLPDRYFPSDSVFAILHRFEKAIGFPVDSLPVREYVKDIPYGGLSLAIRIPSDSRFLVNPTKGKGFYEVAFHEYGHSLQAVYTSVEEPILKGYEWIPGAHCPAYAEGIAELHKEFTDDAKWLTTYTKARLREIEKYNAGKSIPIIYRARRLLKDFFIEYALYNNPDQDAAALERDMYSKYLLVDVPDGSPHLFAANIWYTSYPCYFQNYILAGMIGTQLQEALYARFGEEKIANPGVSPWMVDYLYADGELTEWTERIREATGKGLETGAYLRKMGIVE